MTWPHHYFRGLGTYKAERDRGIVHTPEADAHYRILQQQYDDLTRDWPVDDFDGWIVRWRLTKGVRDAK